MCRRFFGLLGGTIWITWPNPLLVGIIADRVRIIFSRSTQRAGETTLRRIQADQQVSSINGKVIAPVLVK